jgi:hypothetical protein
VRRGRPGNLRVADEPAWHYDSVLQLRLAPEQKSGLVDFLKSLWPQCVGVTLTA